MRVRFFVATLLAAVVVSACDPAVNNSDDDALVVYSARKEHLIKPLFDRFTEETGIKINYITDSAGPLLSRLVSEGENSPADILMTVDAGNLWQAAEQGVLQPLDSPVLRANVPPQLQDKEGRWFGLAIRARTLVYSTERVKPSDLSSYEALADEKWQGRLCLRTSKKVYNQSLVASMIVANGAVKTEEILAKWVKNFAVPPFSSDSKLILAIAVDQCDVGLVNTYYLARELAEQPDLPVGLFWANQNGRGTHVNVAGAGVTKASKRVEKAQQLLEWLSEETAQADFAALNQEYPVNPRVGLPPVLKAWGTFKADEVPVTELGRLQADAIKMMDRVGYR